MYAATIFSNKYVQAALVFVLIVGGYVLYKNVVYNLDLARQAAEQQVTTEEMYDAMEENMEGMGMEASEKMDLSGIHIMPNGDVMSGDGTILEDATTLEDDTIQLRSGAIVTPVMDMRQ